VRVSTTTTTGVWDATTTAAATPTTTDDDGRTTDGDDGRTVTPATGWRARGGRTHSFERVR